MSKKENKENKLNKEQKQKNSFIAQKVIPTIIIILGLAVCGTLVFFGVKNVIHTSKENTKIEEHMSVEEIEKRQKELKEEENKLLAEKSKEFSSGGFTENYYILASKLSDINEEYSKLSTEKFRVENGFYDSEKVEHGIGTIITGMIFFVPAAVILIIAIIIANSIKASSVIKENIAAGNDVFHSIAAQIRDKNSTYKEFKCPNCGAKLKGKEDEEECVYCGAKLHKTMK